MIRPRPASLEDASACATILNDWVDATAWMPRVHPRDDVVRQYRKFVLKERDVYVIGTAVQAFIALDLENYLTALYSARLGSDLGGILLGYAKTLRPALSLWTFEANIGAGRFYEREGFVEVARTKGDNEEALPDIRYHWDGAR